MHGSEGMKSTNMVALRRVPQSALTVEFILYILNFVKILSLGTKLSCYRGKKIRAHFVKKMY